MRRAIRRALWRTNCWDSGQQVLRRATRRDGRRRAEALRSDVLFDENCSAQTVGIAVGKYCGAQTDGMAIDDWKQ